MIKGLGASCFALTCLENAVIYSKTDLGTPTKCYRFQDFAGIFQCVFPLVSFACVSQYTVMRRHLGRQTPSPQGSAAAPVAVRVTAPPSL